MHPEHPTARLLGATPSAAAHGKLPGNTPNMFQEIWFRDTEAVLAFFCNGLPRKGEWEAF